MKVFVSISAVVLVLLVGTGIAEEKKVYRATIDKDGVQRVNIQAGSYFFDPNYLIVKLNVPVEITIKKEPEMIAHDFVISAPEAGMDVKEPLSKEPKVIKLTPTRVGKYPFYCDHEFLFFRSHRVRGMEGTIEVTE
jgi:plastocyanin